MEDALGRAARPFGRAHLADTNVDFIRRGAEVGDLVGMGVGHGGRCGVEASHQVGAVEYVEAIGLRRLAERPANVRFFLRSLASSG